MARCPSSVEKVVLKPTWPLPKTEPLGSGPSPLPPVLIASPDSAAASAAVVRVLVDAKGESLNSVVALPPGIASLALPPGTAGVASPASSLAGAAGGGAPAASWRLMRHALIRDSIVSNRGCAKIWMAVSTAEGAEERHSGVMHAIAPLVVAAAC